MDWNRDAITLVFTDSGLGGLACTAEVVERLRARRAVPRIRALFLNCLPSQKVGFDSMESDERRFRVFHNVLECIADRWAPDAILIACNTLSVLYAHTPFAARARIPVLGTVEAGADLVADYLAGAPASEAILFAAFTTVHMGTHHRRLVERGFAPERIRYQQCHGLIGAIERDVRGEGPRRLVSRFVGEALARTPDPTGPLGIGLMCTHFGYAAGLFESALREQGAARATILDPNTRMTDAFLADAPERRCAAPRVTVEVVSQTPIGAECVRSLGPCLAAVSPQTAAALAGAVCVRGMFGVE